MHVPISLHQPISDYAQDNHATVSCSYCKEQAEMWGSHPRDLCPSAPPVMQFPLEEKNHSFALRQYTSWFILTGTWWLHSLNSRKRNLIAFSGLEKAWQFVNNSGYTFLSFQFLATKQKITMMVKDISDPLPWLCSCKDCMKEFCLRSRPGLVGYGV